MTLSNHLFGQNTNYNAVDVRHLATAVVPATGGVFGANDFKVTCTGSLVQVAAGRLVMTSTRSTDAPRFLLGNNATMNAQTTGGSTTWTAASAGNSRVDVVYAKVHDQNLDGGAVDSSALIFQTGTLTSGVGATAPVIALADAYYVLAHIYSYNSGGIVVTDKRTMATGAGGISWMASGNRPTSGAWEGQAIYETDTDALKLWTGSGTTGWQPPWNMPWGVLGTINGATIGLTTGEVTCATTASITIPAANRRVRASMVIGVNANQNGFHFARLRRAGTQIALSTFKHSAGTVDYTSVPISVVETPAAGSYVYTATVQLAAGTGTTDAGSTTMQLVVEDIGPSAAPA